MRGVKCGAGVQRTAAAVTLADRAFLRDVLKLTNVDVGGGWLIFGLPPAEVAVHPVGKERRARILSDVRRPQRIHRRAEETRY